MQLDSAFLATQASYMRWATERVLGVCRTIGPEQLSRDLGNSFGGVFNTLLHVFGADVLWLGRLRGNPGTGMADVSATDNFEQLEAAWLPLLAEVVEVCGSLDPESAIAYVRLNGEHGEMPAWQTVMHLVNHSTWHLGQVVTMLRQLGHTGISVDIAIFYREMNRGFGAGAQR